MRTRTQITWLAVFAAYAVILIVVFATAKPASPPPDFVKEIVASVIAIDANPGTSDTVTAEYAVSNKAVRNAWAGALVSESDENSPEYVVVMHGSFTHWNYHGPAGSHAPYGDCIVLTIDPKSQGIDGYGIGKNGSVNDLSTIGSLIPFSVGNTSAAAMIQLFAR